MEDMSIKLFGINYLIRCVDENPLSEEYMIGQVNDKTATITICSGMPPDVEFSTLLHEVIHTISSKLHLNLEEDKVVALESGIMSVIMDEDNQAVFNYYLHQCREK